MLIESGITLNPTGPSFRFQDCTAYNSLYFIKEMDYCWFEEQTNTLWLIELKNFNHPDHPVTLSTGNKNTDKRMSELMQKTVHSVLMLYLSRGGFDTCYGVIPVEKAKVRVLHILNVQHKDEHFLPSLNSSLQAQLKLFQQQFGLLSVNILSYQQARNRFSWVE